MDYSPFYFQKFYNKKNKKRHSEPERPPKNAFDSKNAYQPQEDEINRPPVYEETDIQKIPVERGEKKDRAGFFTALVIILSFAVVTVCAGLFGGGAVLNSLKSAFKPGYSVTYYYLTTGAYNSEYAAVTQVPVIVEKGGAGYVYAKESQYYVVIATYLDKKTAESVRKKNSGTEIHEIEAVVPDYSSLSVRQEELFEKSAQKIISAIEVIYDVTKGLDGGTMDEAGAKEKMSDLRDELLTQKQDIAESSIPAEYKNYLNNITDAVFGGLDAITSMDYSGNLAAALRNVIACGASALYSQKPGL